MTQRRCLIALLFAITALLLAGCGGGDSTATDPSAMGGTGTTTPPAGTTGGTPISCDGTATCDAGGTDGGASTLPETDGGDVAGLGALNAGNSFTPGANMDAGLGDVCGDSCGASTGDPYGYSDSSYSYSDGGSSSGGSSTSTPSSAKITLNGKSYSVKKGSIFPKTEQLFRVKSIDSSEVTIELVAGQFTDGSDGILLKLGVQTRLLNQDEGESYLLKLVSVSSG